MVEKTLVESQLADAAELVRRLDSLGETPAIVVWNYFSDATEWKLLIAGPSLDLLLPKSEAVAYQRVAEGLNKPSPLSSLTIGEIRLLRTDNPLLNMVRFLISTGPQGLVQANFSNTSINGVFVEQMVVLRAS